jgi:hypothetical protein
LGAELEVIVKSYSADDGLYELVIPGASAHVEDWSDLVEGTVVEARITGANTGGLECKVGRANVLQVKTDPVASPTGFPFKVVELAGSLSQEEVYVERRRICDLGYLRHAYKQDDGTIGWRCGAEPVEAYLRKGGKQEETCGKKCVCNALMANIDLGQVRKQDGQEKPLVTSGDDVREVARLLPSPDAIGYSAEDVVAYLLSAVETSTVAAR